jgi:outer membrane protein assembly factor BamB
VGWGTDHVSLYCLDSETGEQKWQIQNPVAGATELYGIGEEAAVYGQILGEGGIRGVDLATGKEKWHIAHLGSTDRLGGVVEGGVIWLVTSDGSGAEFICEIDLKTGVIVSQIKSPFSSVGGEVSLNRDAIYGTVLSDENNARQLFAISRSSGTVLWVTDVADLDEGQGPPQDEDESKGALDGIIVAEDRVFVTQFSGKLWCLDARTGSPAWSYASHPGRLYVPARAEGRLYFRKRDLFICIDEKDGRELFTARHDGNTTSLGKDAGVVAGDYFFFSDNWSIFALALKDGSEKWRVNYSKRRVNVWGPCIVSGGRLYVSGGDNFIYCFGSK